MTLQADCGESSVFSVFSSQVKLLRGLVRTVFLGDVALEGGWVGGWEEESKGGRVGEREWNTSPQKPTRCDVKCQISLVSARNLNEC